MSLGAVLRCFAFIRCLIVVESSIPEGYIAKVLTDCGPNAVEDANITVIMDLHLSAKARCAGSTLVNFTKLDLAHAYLPVSYPGSDVGSSSCVFSKRKDAWVYFIGVEILYGDTEANLQQHEEHVTVTCTFGPSGSDDSSNRNVSDSLVAPQELQTHAGVSHAHSVTLKLCDITGQDLAGHSTDLGRKVMLEADTTVNGSKGLRPVSCDAVASGGSRYAILRASCGDGIVFDKEDGFLIEGPKATSPIFRLFTLGSDPVIKFECNFTICESCNGMSCRSVAKREEPRTGLADQHTFLFGETDSFRVTTNSDVNQDDVVKQDGAVRPDDYNGQNDVVEPDDVVQLPGYNRQNDYNRQNNVIQQDGVVQQNDVVQQDDTVKQDVVQQNDVIEQNDVVQHDADVVQQNDDVQQDDFIQQNVVQQDDAVQQNDIDRQNHVVQQDDDAQQNDVQQDYAVQKNDVQQNDIDRQNDVAMQDDAVQQDDYVRQDDYNR